MNGIDNGYLNLSAFDALILAMMTQITLRKIKKITIGIPIKMKKRGMARTI